jgi:hypothetical protein
LKYPVGILVGNVFPDIAIIDVGLVIEVENTFYLRNILDGLDNDINCLEAEKIILAILLNYVLELFLKLSGILAVICITLS